MFSGSCAHLLSLHHTWSESSLMSQNITPLRPASLYVRNVEFVSFLASSKLKDSSLIGTFAIQVRVSKARFSLCCFSLSIPNITWLRRSRETSPAIVLWATPFNQSPLSTLKAEELCGRTIKWRQKFLGGIKVVPNCKSSKLLTADGHKDIQVESVILALRLKFPNDISPTFSKSQ